MNKVNAEYKKRFTVRISEKQYEQLKEMKNPSEYIRKLIDEDIKPMAT